MRWIKIRCQYLKVGRTWRHTVPKDSFIRKGNRTCHAVNSPSRRAVITIQRVPKWPSSCWSTLPNAIHCLTRFRSSNWLTFDRTSHATRSFILTGNVVADSLTIARMSQIGAGQDVTNHPSKPSEVMTMASFAFNAVQYCLYANRTHIPPDGDN